MLNAIVKWLIARRWLVVIASIMITLWGLRVLTQMPLDVFLSFTPPQVKIGAELKRADAYLDGKKAVVVVVNKQPPKAVFEGLMERLAAILMTALTWVLGTIYTILKKESDRW